jgi:hypothetical protein
MFNEVPSSNPPDLPVPAEGAYVWHLEVIVVVVGINPVSREYETAQLSILPALEPLIQKELNKYFDARIIFHV